jgi:hypothetical protein
MAGRSVMRRGGRPAVASACLLALFSVADADVFTYPGPPRVPPSDQYAVKVIQDGRVQASFVYCSVAKWRTNRSRTTSWTTFSFSGKVLVAVTKLQGTFAAGRILPGGFGIACSKQGNTLLFTLDRPRKVSVEFDGDTTHPLLVFADAPETDVPEPGAPGVVYYGPGLHELSEPLLIRSQQTVYLAGGAYVKGRLTCRDAQDIVIRGRGVLSGETLEKGGENLLHLKGWRTAKALVEGITLVDSPHYVVQLEGAGHTVRNVKLIGWHFNTDGVGMGPEGVVEDCFFKVNDDAVKLYHAGMRVRDCVFWQMENGAPFQISWNMPGAQSGFRVSNCDVLRVEHAWDNDNEAVFNAIHGGTGVMSDYLFEDIRIENAPWRLVHLLMKKTEFAPRTGWGGIANVTFRNITVDGPQKRPNTIRGADGAHRIENVTFENVNVNGKVWTSAADANLEIDPATTANVRFIADPTGR